MRSISLEDYLKIKDTARTIDVRTPNEVKTLLNFDWAENIYVSELMRDYKKHFPNKDETIITVCNAGNRSGDAAQFLQDHDYPNAYVLSGGIYNYYRHKK